MEIIQWLRAQPWWKFVLPLLEGGLHVGLHVRDMPPTYSRGEVWLTSPGGRLWISRCAECEWHIADVRPPPEGYVDTDDVDEVDGEYTPRPEELN